MVDQRQAGPSRARAWFTWAGDAACSTCRALKGVRMVAADRPALAAHRYCRCQWLIVGEYGRMRRRRGPRETAPATEQVRAAAVFRLREFRREGVGGG